MTILWTWPPFPRTSHTTGAKWWPGSTYIRACRHIDGDTVDLQLACCGSTSGLANTCSREICQTATVTDCKYLQPE